MLNSLKNQLLEELKTCHNDDEKLKLIEKYSEKMSTFSDQIDERKKLDIEQLINQITADERNKKEEFYSQKRIEAVNNGVDPMEIVPNIEFDDEYEKNLKADLEKLAIELQKLGADISKDWPPKQMSDELKNKLNEEMQAKINAINSLRPVVNSDQSDHQNINNLISENIDEINNYVRKRGNMQNKLKNKMKRRVKKMTESEDENFGQAEKAVDQLVQEANSQAIINTVLEALDENKSSNIEDKLGEKLLVKGADQTQEYIDGLLGDYRNQCNQLKSIDDDRKNTFKNRLNERLNARAILMKNLASDKAAENDLKLFTNKHAPENALNPSSINQKLQASSSQKQKENFDNLMTKNQINQLDQLEKHHDSEQEKLEQELNSEKIEEIIQLDVNLNEKYDKLANDIDSKINSQIEAAGLDLNSAAAEQLLNQAEQDKNRIKNIINSQKAKQLKMINQAKRERRDRKVKLLQEQQKLETNQVLKKLADERFQENKKFSHQRDLMEMVDEGKKDPITAKREMLEKLLQKQAQEVDKAMSTNKIELKLALA